MPMLLAIKELSQVSYSGMMALYEEDLLKTAKADYPALPAAEARMEAEQDFYAFLAEVFFRTGGACLFVWEVEGRWVSCLRTEPYLDGHLICGITTDPACRRMGYAQSLLQAVTGQIPGVLYSHVEKSNAPSLALHKKCGFSQQLEYAEMLNGEILHNFYTFSHGK